METIDPAKSIDEVHRRATAALDTFQFPNCPLASADECWSCFTRFFRHAENTMLRARGSFAGDAKMDFSRVCSALTEEYGENGLRVATRMALYGIEGGIRAVLRAIAVRLAKRFSDNEIRNRIEFLWGSLSVDEKFETVREYLASDYSNLLPEDLKEGRAPEIYANLPRYLEKHPEIIRRLRRAVRQ
ncbi:MAG: hypothetical protein HUU46_07380 [Candidatus Hydrogenedentes bacterium]|nr:hypothetical protein [Candidatus Hydrogenedentota bacterium]